MARSKRLQFLVLIPVLMLIWYWVTELLREPLPVSTGYIISNPGCYIPKLNLFHPSVKNFFKSPRVEELSCDEPELIIRDKNILRLNQTEVSTGSVNCFLREIYRFNESHSVLRKEVRFDNESMVAPSEFVQVECRKTPENTRIYIQFYPFVFPKKTVEERIRRYKEKEKENDSQTRKFRVLLLGLDSASKNLFLRHMPKTRQFISDNLVYAEMHGYNKLGEGTLKNILPMLSGKLESEFVNISKTPADLLPLIWKNYTENGYRTLFGEEIPQWAIFNFQKMGFGVKPTDYYLRPWSIPVARHIRDWRYGCINEKLEVDVYLKYLEDFFDLFPNDPLFALMFLSRMSHNDINGLRYQDRPVRNFLERLGLKGHLNNTIVIFFGDHGFRFGGYRSSYIGRLEDRLPNLYVLLPHWFPSKHPQMYQNLKTNERRLTTPLDIYATLEDLLNFDEKAFDHDGSGRSISLLKYKIPLNRTCEDAFIESQWCSCVASESVSVGDQNVQVSALEIVKKLNSYTKDHRSKCAQLSLVSILSANKQTMVLADDSRHKDFTNFLIIVQVFPGNGIFEGSVWFNDKSWYSVDVTIQRINRYKNQSSCVKEKFLKPVCYCVV